MPRVNLREPNVREERGWRMAEEGGRGEEWAGRGGEGQSSRAAEPERGDEERLINFPLQKPRE